MKVTEEMIDPELRFAARLLRAIPSISSVKALRRVDRVVRFFLQGKRPKDLHAEEIRIARRDGQPLRLMIYKPLRADPALPGILWLHGGGYQMGLPEAEVATYRRLMATAPCIIVAPDYRLSIEQPYPAALDDCYDALLWMKQNADLLGIRDDQIAVAGGSAGGGLTAAVSLLARDRGKVQLAFQIPLYPMIDDRMRSESATDNDATGWNSVANQVGWKNYLGPLFGGDVPAYAAPARAMDYRGLPPTCTFVGSVDPFRDETIQYVENLKAAGVPVAFELFSGGYHGFEGLCPRSALGQRALTFFLDWYRHAVRSYFAPQQKPGA